MDSLLDGVPNPYPRRVRLSQYVVGGSVLRVEIPASDGQLAYLSGIDAVVSGSWNEAVLGAWYLAFTCNQSLANVYDTATPTGLDDPLQIAILAEQKGLVATNTPQYRTLHHYWRPPAGGRVLIPGDLLVAFVHNMVGTTLDAVVWLWLGQVQVSPERALALKAAWGSVHLLPRT